MILASCSKLDREGGLPRLDISNARYIFQTAPSTKAMDSEEEGYWKMTINGSLEAIALCDENGKPQTKEIYSIGEVGDNFLYADTDYTVLLTLEDGGKQMCKQFLVNKKTGEMFIFPKNVRFPYISKERYNAKLWSIEYGNKLYLIGESIGVKDPSHYYVELDSKTQTATRCTPEGMDARNLVVGKDGVIAFSSDGYSYVMTSGKKMKQYGSANYSRIISDSDHNLYLINSETNRWEYVSISKIIINGSEIEEQFICYFPEVDSFWDYNLYATINSKNNNIILMTYEVIFEFDGKSVKHIGYTSEFDVRTLDNYGFDGALRMYGYIHNYYFKIPVNNQSVASNYDNKVVLIHLDLDTYKVTQKTLDMYPESDYHLVGEIENNGVNLTYSCIRYSDSHTVTFIMDYDGHYEIIHDSSSSFSASNLLMLN